MRITLVLLSFLCMNRLWPQQPADSVQLMAADSNVHRKQQWLLGSATVAVTGGTLILLDRAWYRDHPRSSFHSFNDAGEWLQMDKAGHIWSAYSISRAMTASWRRAGLPAGRSLLIGTGTALGFLLSVEYLDGKSAEWGWSWADAAANFTGAAVFAAQEIAWKEQRITIKFSAHHKSYPVSLRERAKELYGNSLAERLLKDYNAQTYWLSANLKSFFPGLNLPPWLNFAAGYGADGLFGGFENMARDKDGNIFFDRRDIPRLRQWYIAPDIDLNRIQTGSRLLRSLLSTAAILKFPAPALRYSGNRLSFHLIAF